MDFDGIGVFSPVLPKHEKTQAYTFTYFPIMPFFIMSQIHYPTFSKLTQKIKPIISSSKNIRG